MNASLRIHMADGSGLFRVEQYPNHVALDVGDGGMRVTFDFDDLDAVRGWLADVVVEVDRVGRGLSDNLQLPGAAA